LYENTNETIFEAQRPIVLNGIEDFATRDDLQDRALTLTLPAIADDKRRAEADVWAEFDRAHPRLLGAVLDALVVSLRDGDVRLDQLPRMADFARRAYAAAPALGWTGAEFLKAYTENRKQGAEASIEASAAVMAVVALVTVAEKGEITITAGDLLLAINKKVEEKQRHDGWPKNPRAMAGLLTRYAPALRRNGIDVEQLERTGRSRPWRLAVSSGAGPSQPSSPSPADSDRGDDRDTEDRHEPSLDRHTPSPDPASPEPECDGRDGNDGVGGLSSACPTCGEVAWLPP
jgi:hypothetical protein